MTATVHDLALLAAMVRDAELARLRKFQDARQKAEVALNRLHSAQQNLALTQAPDPAHLSGTDGRWLSWAAGQSRSLSIASAQAAASAEAQMVKARRAFGRSAVLDKLSGKS